MTGALESTLGRYRFVQRTMDKQVQMYRANPMVRGDIKHFEVNIGKASSLDDLMKKDFRSWRTLLTAFGLEDQANQRALAKKVLESDLNDRRSLANTIKDGRWKSLAAAVNFKESGLSNLKQEAWVDNIVDRIVSEGIEKKEGETNEGVRLALYFKRQAPFITNWFQTMADKAVGKVIRTAFGLPDSFARLDVDQQRSVLEQRGRKEGFTIADFKDPKKVERLIEKFSVRFDMQNSQGRVSNSPLLSLFQAGGQNAAFQPISIDPRLALARYQR
jgi:hypothetical protein